MSRAGLDASVLTAAQSGHISIAYAIKFDFPGGALRETTAPRSVTYNSETYNSNGRLIDMSGVSERADGKPALVTFSLAPDATVRALVDDDDWQFSKATPVLLVLDDDYSVLGSFPMGQFYMSTANQAIAEKQRPLEIECEAVITDLSRNHPVYPSPRDQRLRSAGDTYFDVSSKDRVFEWAGFAHYSVGGGGIVFWNDFGSENPITPGGQQFLDLGR